MSADIVPIQLQKMATSIASAYGDEGAIIITSGKEGIRMGFSGLSNFKAQEALCVAIHHIVKRNLE